MKGWIVFLFLGMFLPGFSQDVFYKVLGSRDWDEIGLQTLKLSGGDLMLMGTISSDTLDSDVLLMRLTPDGKEVKWQKSVGTPGKDFSNALVYDSTRQLVFVLGKTTQYFNNSTDAMLLCLDTSGNLQWMKIFGDTVHNENITAADLDTSLGIAFTGFTTAPGGLKNNIWSGVFNLEGDLLWERYWATPENEVGNAVVILPDRSVAIAGDQNVPPVGYDILVGRYSPQGDSLWEMAIRDDLNGGSQEMILSEAGDLIISGESYTQMDFAFDVTISRVDTSGYLKWHRFLPGTNEGEAGFAIIQPDAGHFILSGYGYSDSTQNSEAFFWLTDTAANLLDQKSFGGASADIGYNLLDDGNGWFFGTGLTGEIDQQILLVHDYFDLTATGIKTKTRTSDIYLYPNPVTGNRIFVKSGRVLTSYKILDQAGRLIHQGQLSGQRADLPDFLSRGYYFLQLHSADTSEYGKFIIVR